MTLDSIITEAFQPVRLAPVLVAGLLLFPLYLMVQRLVTALVRVAWMADEYATDRDLVQSIAEILTGVSLASVGRAAAIEQQLAVQLSSVKSRRETLERIRAVMGSEVVDEQAEALRRRELDIQAALYAMALLNPDSPRRSSAAVSLLTYFQKSPTLTPSVAYLGQILSGSWNREPLVVFNAVELARSVLGRHDRVALYQRLENDAGAPAAVRQFAPRLLDEAA